MKPLSIVGIAAGVIVLIVLVVYGFKAHARWVDECEAKGGRVDSDTTWITTYDNKGTPHMNSHTTYYCFGPNGLIGVE